jgi:hypothetical protein
VKIIITSLASLLVGVGVGIGAYHLHFLDQAAANAKTRWLVCGVHQDALYERADQYHQKLGRWPTNVQELVEAHFLPEFSEVHLCPSQAGAVTRTDYQSSTWVDQNQTGLVASYVSSPYHFQVVSGKFTVVCSFDMRHTR